MRHLAVELHTFGPRQVLGAAPDAADRRGSLEAWAMTNIKVICAKVNAPLHYGSLWTWSLRASPTSSESEAIFIMLLFPACEMVCLPILEQRPLPRLRRHGGAAVGSAGSAPRAAAPRLRHGARRGARRREAAGAALCFGLAFTCASRRRRSGQNLGSYQAQRLSTRLSRVRLRAEEGETLQEVETVERTARARDEAAAPAAAEGERSMESAKVRRLKEMVFRQGMKVAITSGEFALRLGGAEEPGLVDYEGLCNLLDGFADRPGPERNEGEGSACQKLQDRFSALESGLSHRTSGRVLRGQASEDLRVIRAKLQERLVAMTKAQQPERSLSSGPPEAQEKVDQDSSANKAVKAAPSKFMLYLRADETVDIDTALQDGKGAAGRCLFLVLRRCRNEERLEGKTEQHSNDWMSPEEGQAVDEGEKEEALQQAKKHLETAYAKRSKVLKKMSQDGAGAEDTSELFRCDREISGRRNLALLASVEYIYEKVAWKLEKLLEQATIAEWDISGRRLKLLVYEFALLDKQVAPYRIYLQQNPEDEGVRGLDLDELQMLETHFVRIAGRVGLQVERINQRQGFFALVRRQKVSLRSFWQKIRRGLVFQASGVRLLSQDLQHALKLVLKVLFLNHALQQREDLLVLVPFLIILLIPLSPPGHMLVFSLIVKVYPDFVPSPFTEHRQNVMRIYNEIKPVSEKRSLCPARPETGQESAKEMVRDWQRKLRSEVRGVDRSIRKIEQEEDKIRGEIKAMASKGGDPKSVQMLAKSLVRSSKAKARLYTSRSIMQSAAAELETTAATMRLSDSMSKSTEVMKQMNSLVRIPEMEESISSMKREMMRAGLIEEMMDEGMEDLAPWLRGRRMRRWCALEDFF
eukprot:g9715.t1